MAHAQLISYSYSRGSDILHVEAIVDDAVQVLPATQLDPPEFDSAHCEAVILWDEPLDHTNAPSREQVERMLPWITDWCAIPPITFDDD
jgi:hypothetical protein